MRRYSRPPGEGRLIQLVYYGYVAGSALVRLIPERLAYGLASAAGPLAARRSKKRDVVALNLSRITGKPATSEIVQKLVVDAYRSYMTYWLETFRFVREGKDFFLERLECRGEEHLIAATAQGKGIIIIVGHMGNWDAAGAWIGATGRRLVTVAEVLRPRRMFDFFVDHRAKLGMTIYPAQPGAREQLIKEVEGGAVVAILGDRDIKGTGIEAEFFGETATFPRGPALVAFATGAPLMVAGVYNARKADGKRGWIIELTEPLDVPEGRDDAAAQELTQTVVSRLEEMVAKAPEQWHVFQPVWPAARENDS